MRDITKIRLKVISSVLFTIAPLVVLYFTGNPRHLFGFGYSGIWIHVMFRNENNFKGYLRTMWSFYVKKEWRSGLSKNDIELLKAKRDVIIRNEIGMYELPLIKNILKINGLRNYKEKFTGKRKHKIRAKLTHLFEDKSKNVYGSSYKNKSKKFAG